MQKPSLPPSALQEALKNPVAYLPQISAEIERKKLAIQIQQSQELSAILRADFRLFVQHAWPQLFPKRPFMKNFATEAICDHSAALALGQITRLVMNVPPGSAKSSIFSILLKCWMWARDPVWKSTWATYGQDLSDDFSVRSRDLLMSDWYQQVFRPSWAFRKDQNDKAYYVNTAKGWSMATSVGGKVTGWRGNFIGLDDPLNAADANSPTKLQACSNWFDQAAYNRLEDLDRDSIGLIMQRLHERDLSGHLLAEGGWEWLMIPMEYDPKRSRVTAIGWKDPRTKEGELMFPELFSPAAVANLKKKPRTYAGQYQQNPTPDGGNIFQEHWWRYFKYPEAPGQPKLPPVQVKNEKGEYVEIQAVVLPADGDDFQSWDMSFDDTDNADEVCGGVIRKSGANYYVLTIDKEKKDFPSTVDAIESMTRAYPNALAKLIEAKANGPAIMKHLKDKISGMIPIIPKDGKEQRAHACAPLVRAGNVFLPHPAIAAWVKPFIASLAAFPKGAHDDDVDMLTQALNYIQQGVFTVEKKRVVLAPFSIDVNWKRGVGVFIGPDSVGAVWMAQDPQNKSIYIYDEFFRRDADWMLHANEIKRRSGRLPVFLDCHRELDIPGYRVKYQTQGLDVSVSREEIEPAIAGIQSDMNNGTLRVFSPCTRWVEEVSLMVRGENGKIAHPEQWVVMGATRAAWAARENFGHVIQPNARPQISRGGGTLGWVR